MQEVKKIVVIGPESTGKSTLCKQLADHYKTIWCPEYAREYLLKHGKEYTYDNLLEVAKGQVALEDEYLDKVRQESLIIRPQQVGNLPLLFVDTDMYVMKVWCEFVFDKCHQYILDKIVERPADLYLLCNIDHPWIEDELREYPDLESREKLYHIYKDIMVNQTVMWVDVYGGYEERLQRAITGIDTYFFETTGV